MTRVAGNESSLLTGYLTFHLEAFTVILLVLQGDHNHLFIRQGTGLQGQAVFRTKLSFRPHSTDSFTHRKILSSLADRSLKTSAVKVLSQVMKDPDIKRDELYKVCPLMGEIEESLNNT